MLTITTENIISMIIIISTITISIMVLRYIHTYLNLKTRELSLIEFDSSINSGLSYNDVIDELDNMIMSCITEYIAMNPEFSNDYINSESEAKFISYVTETINSRISYLLVKRLSIYIDIDDGLPEVIANRVYLATSNMIVAAYIDNTESTNEKNIFKELEKEYKK